MTAPQTKPSILNLRNLVFGWDPHLTVLDIPEFSIESGEQVFLRGPSGSGKSTLLGLIAGVLPMQAGELTVFDQDMAKLSAQKRDQLRADRMGVIFQMFNLLPWLGVGENILLPCQFSTARAARISDGLPPEQEARRLMERLGLPPRQYWNARAQTLSVGQQQRVAAARALIGAPDLIIADEPTSALDTDLRNQFINLLLEETQNSGAALLFVSHDRDLAGRFTRVADLSDMNNATVEPA